MLVVTVASADRSFRKSTVMKNLQENETGQSWLNYLAILEIEHKAAAKRDISTVLAVVG